PAPPLAAAFLVRFLTWAGLGVPRGVSLEPLGCLGRLGRRGERQEAIVLAMLLVHLAALLALVALGPVLPLRPVGRGGQPVERGRRLRLLRAGCRRRCRLLRGCGLPGSCGGRVGGLVGGVRLVVLLGLFFVRSAFS